MNHWRQYAACKGMDPEVFYPNAGRNERVQKLCDPCPVKAECLEFARVTETPKLRHGIWGGVSAREREVMFDGRKPVVSKVKVSPPPRPKVVRTHCKHGHEWVPSNIVIRLGKHGRERELCRQCERNRSAEYKQRNTA